jgi:hypothetical protein
MTPHAIAQAWHTERHPGIPFAEVIAAHSAGLILSTPTFFLLARPLHSSRPDADFSDLDFLDPDGDALHVWIATGSIPIAYRSLIPPGIRLLTWHRLTLSPHLRRFPVGFPISE